MQKHGLKKIILSLALAASGGWAGNIRQEAPSGELVTLGELVSRYCFVYACGVDLSPKAMNYTIVKPSFDMLENKIFLEAQLKSFAHEFNHSCRLTDKVISCVPKVEVVEIIDTTNYKQWQVITVPVKSKSLHEQVIANNSQYSVSSGPVKNDTVSYPQFSQEIKPSLYLYKIKVLILITEFDLGYKIVNASYISDLYESDFAGSLKYGTTVKETRTTQTAENGTQTSSFVDKLQGLEITNRVIVITANNRDLEVDLFGGSQSLLQVRKECKFSLFGFELFCGLVQTEIFISLE